MQSIVLLCNISNNITLGAACRYEAAKSFYYNISVVIPSIENSIDNEVRNQEENVTFLCQNVGQPVPDISWYFNDIMINVPDSSNKYMIVSRSLNITTIENALTVYNVTSSDVGTYTCNSSNIIGSVTSFRILTVTSKFIKVVKMHSHIQYCVCISLYFLPIIVCRLVIFVTSPATTGHVDTF